MQRQEPNSCNDQRSRLLLEEYTKAKDVTRRRLFIETLTKASWENHDKVIIEGGEKGHGVVPYLLLPEIEKRKTTAAPITGVK